MKRTLWYIPLLLLMHNAEEALTMPQWISVHLDLLRVNYPIFEHVQFSTPQLYLSLALITVIPLIISLRCISGELTKRSIMTLMILQSIIFWNALVPHLLGSYLLQMYNPGVVTALFCNIPFTFYLGTMLVKEKITDNVQLRNAAVAGLLIYLPVVYLNHLTAHFFARLL